MQASEASSSINDYMCPVLRTRKNPNYQEVSRVVGFMVANINLEVVHAFSDTIGVTGTPVTTNAFISAPAVPSRVVVGATASPCLP